MSGPNSTSGNIPYTTSQPVTSTPPEKPDESGVNSLGGRRYIQKPETTPAAASIHMRTTREQKGVLPIVNREKAVDELQSAYKTHNAQAESKRDLLDLAHSLKDIRHYLDNPALAKKCTRYSILWIPDEGQPISVIPPGTELNDRTKATEIRGMLYNQLEKLDQKFTGSKLQELQEEIEQQENLMQVAAQKLTNLGAPLPVLPLRERIVFLGDAPTKRKQPAPPTPQHGPSQPSPQTSGVKPTETLHTPKETTMPSGKFELHPKRPEATPLAGRFELRLKTPDAVPHREPFSYEKNEGGFRANFNNLPSSLNRSDDEESLIDVGETSTSIAANAKSNDLLLDDSFELPTHDKQPNPKQPEERSSSGIARPRPKSRKPVSNTIGSLPITSPSPAPVNGNSQNKTPTASDDITHISSETPEPTGILTPSNEPLHSPVNPVSELSLQLNKCTAAVGEAIDANIGKLARETLITVHSKSAFDQKLNTSPLYMGPLHSARKAMLTRAITNFHRKHSQDPLAENRDAMNFEDRVIPVIELGVLSTKPTPHTVMNQKGKRGFWLEAYNHLVEKGVPEVTASAIATSTTGYESDPKSNLLDSIMKDVELIESKRTAAGFDISELDTYRLYPDKGAHEELGKLCHEYYEMLLKQGDLPPLPKKGSAPVTTFSLSDHGISIGLDIKKDLNPGMRQFLEKSDDFYELQVERLKRAAGISPPDELSSLGQIPDKNEPETFGKLYIFSQS